MSDSVAVQEQLRRALKRLEASETKRNTLVEHLVSFKRPFLWRCESMHAFSGQKYQ